MTMPPVSSSGTDRSSAGRPGAVDRSVRVTVPTSAAEVVGAILMESLGPFELDDQTPPPPFAPGAQTAGEQEASARVLGKRVSGGPTPSRVATLVFYPAEVSSQLQAAVLAVLPEEVRASGDVRVDIEDVPRDWAEGWKEHFRPIVIGRVRIRPPWELPADPGSGLLDVVINPGLGFGTGLHPTTRGVLELLQQPCPCEEGAGRRGLGPLVDAGTGSGILSISAAKLGWVPVFAFDNDAFALVSARENVVENGVVGIVEIHETDIEGALPHWFSGATVLANMTLDPVVSLIKKLFLQGIGRSESGLIRPPSRLIVSGILAGEQERRLCDAAGGSGFAVARTRHEGEWVSVELMPLGCRGLGSRGPVGPDGS